MVDYGWSYTKITLDNGKQCRFVLIIESIQNHYKKKKKKDVATQREIRLAASMVAVSFVSY